MNEMLPKLILDAWRYFKENVTGDEETDQLLFSTCLEQLTDDLYFTALTPMQEKKRLLHSQISRGVFMGEERIMAEHRLENLSQEVKRINIITSATRNNCEYSKLRIFVRERFGKQPMIDFFNQLRNER